MASGKFITLEGGEGTGKSTQAELLVDRLQDRGLEVVMTREPGGSPFAERLRDLLLDATAPDHSALSEALLFYAARADHLDRLIQPALADGRWVICDRFSDSTRAYQGAAGALGSKAIDMLDSLVVGTTQPDLTLIIDLDVEVGLERANDRRNARHADRFERRDVEFHEKLRRSFLKIAADDPKRCVIIDGNQDIDTISNTIWTIVKERFRLKELT